MLRFESEHILGSGPSQESKSEVRAHFKSIFSISVWFS